jgi:N-methylhydantoinase A
MYKVCVDIGGTFTDAIIWDDKDNLTESKVATTPSDFSQGILDILSDAANSCGKSPEQFISEVELIIHGTTVATNALVTRNVAKTALITSRGFRDIIEIRRCLKIETKSMYEAFIPPYESIVPRYLRFVIDEVTRTTGEILKPVDQEELKGIIEKIKKEAVEAIAICLINSYVNPENEKIVEDICNRELDGVFVTCSSDVLPTMGEYARESTSIICACIGPIVSRYMTNLEEKLKRAGFKGQLLIMQANQFAQSVPALIRKPVYLVGSGPAAAPAGAAYLGKVIGEPNFITADMGGTTLDAALTANGEVALATGHWHGEERIGVKVADVSSIGAGGGSIAWFNSLELLSVGPQSASADPGPACYGKGGDEPTVTDAALILGYLPADYFCGGKIKLDINLAKAAVSKIADRINATIEEAAQAIFTTINFEMTNEIARISTRMGHDVRDFSLLACGGGGAMCGAFWADLLGMKKVIVPKYSPSFCAWSMFTLDIGRDYVRSYIRQLNVADPEEINKLYKEMEVEALEELKVFSVSRKDLLIRRSVDVRYSGQYHEIEVDFPIGKIILKDVEQLAEEFHSKHEKLYTFSLPWVPIELINLRLIAKIGGKKVDVKKILVGKKDPSAALKRKRFCYFGGKYLETPIYDSDKLKAGNNIRGPAIIEVSTTTTVIPQGFQCEIDSYGNYIIMRRS